jgi:hypothetical protein
VIRLLAFCEAAGDFEVGACLADRIFREEGPVWLRELLEHAPLEERREWTGARERETFTPWSAVGDLATKLGVRPPPGFFDGKPAGMDERAARKALAIARHLRKGKVPIDGVLLLRDGDSKPERRESLDRARMQAAAIDPGIVVVIGLPQHEREAWLLAGFEPLDDDERRLVEEIRTEVGFDPRTRAHHLDAIHDADKRSCKRVLGKLTRDDPEREVACYTATPLSTLRERGVGSGLAAFLDEISKHLLPLL